MFRYCVALISLFLFCAVCPGQERSLKLANLSDFRLERRPTLAVMLSRYPGKPFTVTETITLTTG